MIIASAQTLPFEKNIDATISDHLKWIGIASENNAQLVIFPEMSLTGYMRENAMSFALTPDDARLFSLKESAINKRMYIIAGAPVRIGEQLYIGSFIFQPDGVISVYTKQYLHPGEEIAYCSTFENNPVITIEQVQFSLAICADIDHPVHAENAAAIGSKVYMPSIFFSQRGIPDAYQKLGDYSKRYSINILMSNFCGECWNTLSGGKSAFWTDKGELVASLDESNPGLLIIGKTESGWSYKTIQ
jgi:predicted amidohydrolase